MSPLQYIAAPRMDHVALLEALVTQVCFHDDTGVRLDTAFQELDDAGIPIDLTQKAFLSRALLSVNGLWTIPDKTGMPKRARANRDMQEHALGFRLGTLLKVQEDIARAVAQRCVEHILRSPCYGDSHEPSLPVAGSRTQGCTIQCLRRAVDLEPLQIHPHVTVLVRLGLLTRGAKTGLKGWVAVFHARRFAQSSPLNPSVDIGLAHAAVARLLEQMPGGMASCESVPGAVGLSRMAAGALLLPFSMAPGAAAETDNADDDDDPRASAAVSSAASSSSTTAFSVVSDVIGIGGAEKARPCFLLTPRTHSAAARPGGSPHDWAWPSIALAEVGSNAMDDVEGGGNGGFAALELAGPSLAYRMLLLRASHPGGLTVPDMQAQLGLRKRRADRDFDVLVDDLDLQGSLAKVHRGRSHVIGVTADEALAAPRGRSTASSAAADLRGMALYDLAAAWADPFASCVSAAVRGHGQRLLRAPGGDVASAAPPPVDPLLVGGAVLALADGLLSGGGIYPVAAAPGDSACDRTFILPPGLTDGAHPVIPPMLAFDHAGNRLYTALLAPADVVHAIVSEPARVILAPSSRHVTRLATYIKHHDAAMEPTACSASVEFSGQGIRISAVHTDIHALELVDQDIHDLELADQYAHALEDGEQCENAGPDALPAAIVQPGKRRRRRSAVRPLATGDTCALGGAASSAGASAVASATKKRRGGGPSRDHGSLGAVLDTDVHDAARDDSVAAAPRPRPPKAARIPIPRIPEREPIPPMPSVQLSFAASFEQQPIPNFRRRTLWLPSDDRRLIYCFAWQRAFTERTFQELFRWQSARHLAILEQSQALGCATGETLGPDGDLGPPSNEVKAPELALSVVHMDYAALNSALGIDTPTIIRRLRQLRKSSPSAALELAHILSRLRAALGVTAFTMENSELFVGRRRGAPGPMSPDPPSPVLSVLPMITEEWLREATADHAADAAVLNSAATRMSRLPRTSGGSSESSSSEGRSELDDADAREISNEVEKSTDIIDSSRDRGRKRMRRKTSDRAPRANGDVTVLEDPSLTVLPPSAVHQPRIAVIPAASAATAVNAEGETPLVSSVSLAPTLLALRATTALPYYAGQLGTDVDASAARGRPGDPFVGALNDEAVALWKVLRVVVQRGERVQSRVVASASAGGAANLPRSEAFLVSVLRDLGDVIDVPACFSILTQKKFIHSAAGGASSSADAAAIRGRYTASVAVVDALCGGGTGRTDPSAYPSGLMTGWPSLEARKLSVIVGPNSGAETSIMLMHAFSRESLPRVDVLPVSRDVATTVAATPVVSKDPTNCVVATAPAATFAASSGNATDEEARISAVPACPEPAAPAGLRFVDSTCDMGDEGIASDSGIGCTISNQSLAAALMMAPAAATEEAASARLQHAANSLPAVGIEALTRITQQAQLSLVDRGLLANSYVPLAGDAETATSKGSSFMRRHILRAHALLSMQATCGGARASLLPEALLFHDVSARPAFSLASSSLREHADRIALGLRAAVRVSLASAVDTGRHGLAVSDCIMRLAQSMLPAASALRPLGVPSLPSPCPPLLLCLAARIAFRAEFASSALQAVAGFHGEVIVPQSEGASVFKLPSDEVGIGGQKRLFRSWTALVSNSDVVGVEASAVWSLVSRAVTLVSDAAGGLSEARIIAAFSPIAPADVRAILRFLCFRGVLGRSHRILGALAPSPGLFSALETADSLAARAAAAAIDAIAPCDDAAARTALHQCDPEALVHSAAEAWYAVAVPMFGAEAPIDGCSGAAQLSRVRTLAELERAPCDILELPGVITTYHLAIDALTMLHTLAGDLGALQAAEALATAPTASGTGTGVTAGVCDASASTCDTGIDTCAPTIQQGLDHDASKQSLDHGTL